MKIHRPDCMKTPRQGSASIPFSLLLDLASALAASSVGSHQDPAGGYERRHRGHHRERPDFRGTALRVSSLPSMCD